MAQFGRPDADIVDGAWLNQAASAVDMFQSIDEVSASDADFVTSEAAPSNSAVAFGLTTIEDPAVSTGHTMRTRYQKDAAGGATMELISQVRMGYASEVSQGTLIKGLTFSNISNGWVTDATALSGPEADAITDYSDLQVRFQANQT